MEHFPEITRKSQVVIVAQMAPKTKSFSPLTYEVLLLRTNSQRGSFWQNVTGKIEAGENFVEGGKREAIEETHLNEKKIIDLLNLDLNFDFEDQYGRRVHEESFLMIMEEKWDVILDSHEHDLFQWRPLSSLSPDWVKHSSNYEALKKAKQRILERSF